MARVGVLRTKEITRVERERMPLGLPDSSGPTGWVGTQLETEDREGPGQGQTGISRSRRSDEDPGETLKVMDTGKTFGPFLSRVATTTCQHDTLEVSVVRHKADDRGRVTPVLPRTDVVVLTTIFVTRLCPVSQEFSVYLSSVTVRRERWTKVVKRVPPS